MKKMTLMLMMVLLATFVFAQGQPQTPNERLLKAVYDADASAIDNALEEGADIHMKGNLDRNLLIQLVIGTYKYYGTYDIFNVDKYLEDFKRRSVARKLIKLGVAIDEKDRLGDTALMYAATNGYYQVVDLLIAEGAKADEIGCAHSTALIKAIRDYTYREWGIIPHDKFVNIAKLLIKKAPNVIDVQDTNGDTALHLAASRGEKQVVEALIEAGARKDIKNDRNEIAYDYARERYNEYNTKYSGRGDVEQTNLKNLKKIMELTKPEEEQIKSQLNQTNLKKIMELTKPEEEQIKSQLNQNAIYKMQSNISL